MTTEQRVKYVGHLPWLHGREGTAVIKEGDKVLQVQFDPKADIPLFMSMQSVPMEAREFLMIGVNSENQVFYQRFF
jgi:hypothetical protein